MTYPYQDPELSVAERVRDLLSRMTPAEKLTQLVHDSAAVERLDVPAHNWWNEGMHGVSRAGIATVFPQSIGLAAMFDTARMHRIATAISDEARAKHHENARRGDRSFYKGLSYWSPNINIFRDPRWGRGHETYGECPYLTGECAVAYVTGMQGDDPTYLKTIATPKHYAVHSGPEKDRHTFDAVVSEKDLRETYLPHFRTSVVDGGAWSIMAAYNRTNHEPCCASDLLQNQILREEWGFRGYVVSDCGGVLDIHANHGVVKTPEEAAAAALKNGCDLQCDCTLAALQKAYKKGLIADADVDRGLGRLIEARLRLGMFDPDERVPYAQIPFDVVECPEHRALSLDAARASIVLLKNSDSILPLSKSIKAITVIGPNAADDKVLLANYHGTPSRTVTPLEGIRAKCEPLGIRVYYSEGCDLLGKDQPWLGSLDRNFQECIAYAERGDVVVFVAGLSAEIEGEQGDAFNSEAGGDRTHLRLTGVQHQLFQALKAAGKPIVVVLISGSALAINAEHEDAAAIIQQFYPGPQGGTALADVLFGDANPAGRLPVTFYKGMEQLPDYTDYDMNGRTYRFFGGEPLYPFGFGLGYTTFAYSNPAVSSARINAGDSIVVSVDVTNTGGRASDEVVQVYLRDLAASTRVPNHQLVAFERVTVEAGRTRRVHLKIAPRWMAVVNEAGEHVIEPGTFEIAVGGSQGDARSLALGATPSVRVRCEVVGGPLTLPK